ncbi:unnamed protein product [Mesocestoides corti]|uniref:Reverse transcriptase domain-containing protein n=1 Tax=Mesocestoides corti TaxID=53468 RepID=A0A0R3UJK9_MESCO|nr:unnamed protein product [Mesocestoides corti]
MSNLISSQPRSSHTSCFIPRTPSSYTHTFIRHDDIRRPLEPTYDGPLKILRRAENVSVVERNGKGDAVFIDRMKPATLDAETPPSTKPVAQPTPIPFHNGETISTTRYGIIGLIVILSDPHPTLVLISQPLSVSNTIHLGFFESRLVYRILVSISRNSLRVSTLKPSLPGS